MGRRVWVDEWYFGNEKSQTVSKERLTVCGVGLNMEVEGKVGVKKG